MDVTQIKHIVPTAEELQRRREFSERMAELRSHRSDGFGPFPAAEDMIREDRDR
jgi:hypothetical protein